MAIRLRSGSAARDWGLWPVFLLLLVAVVAPTVCLLWFMTAAIRNERLAVRQRLGEAYRGHLHLLRDRLEDNWRRQAELLDKGIEDAHGSAVFARCVRSGLADGVICYDAQGKLVYPGLPPIPKTEANDLQVEWAEAVRLERVADDLVAAADAYAMVAERTSSLDLAARALQARARCLVQAGRDDAAIEVVTESLGQDKYRQAVDEQGRLIVANAELMALQLMRGSTHPGFRPTVDRLKRRLTDYDDPVLAPAQRRFLMKELQRLLRGKTMFPTLAAEELAARFVEAHPSPREDSVLHLSQLPDVWQLASPQGRVVALFHTATVLSNAREAIASLDLPDDVTVRLVPPAEKPPQEGIFHTLPAGGRLPGWQLTLSIDDRQLLDAAASEQIASYLWTGILVIATICILTLLIARTIRRQVRLTRLKNDLVASVSHELKTPLSSIRLLVDTLLDEERFEERKVREYLQLVAKENTRLSRLIDNFLAFSRMERNKHAFEFAEVSAADVVNAAVESVRERFHAASCRFDVEIEPNLPSVAADVDALVTAVLNLLDNAYKYSQDDKRIVLRAYTANGDVCFAVTDNGIGISKRAAKKVFKRFYQVDRSLTRHSGGVGLGLSIVQSIVDAHGGTVRLSSRLGQGSTFTITLPCATAASRTSQGTPA